METLFNYFSRYLDPGTGSMVLQYLAAVILTAILAIKVYFKRVKERLKSAWQKLV